MGKCINAEHHKRLERETKCKENEAEHEKKNKKKCKRTFSENHSFLMKILIFARKTKVIRKAPPINTIHTHEHKMKKEIKPIGKTRRKHPKRTFSKNHAFLMKIHIFARKTRATGTRKTRKSIPAHPPSPVKFKMKGDPGSNAHPPRQ